MTSLRTRLISSLLLSAVFGSAALIVRERKLLGDDLHALMDARYGNVTVERIRDLGDDKRELLERYEAHDALSQALSAVAEIPYDRETMNCYDHSKELQRRLAELDVASSVMINSDRSHAWLAVWVESNTGEFVSIRAPYRRIDYTLLEARGYNQKVICD